MSNLISREALIQTIKDKYDYASATAFLLKMRDILPQDVVYQILAIIDNAPSLPDPNYITATDYENSFIYGYRVKDLMIFGKMFYENGIKSEDLKKYSEAYLDGYKRAYDEINEVITKTVNSIGLKDTDPEEV